MAYEAKDILGIIEAMKHDQDILDLHSDIRLRMSQHAMTDVPWVPDYLMAAGKIVTMNSPRIATLAMQIGGVMSSYATNVHCTPDDYTQQKKADEAKRAYAIRRDDLFTPQVTATQRWRQMVLGAGFYKLECGDPSSKNPWSVKLPDILSCYFFFGDETYKTMRPTRMAREFTVQMNKLKGYANVREGYNWKWSGKKWEQVALTLDKSTQNGWNLPVEYAKNDFEPVSFCEYDNGEESWIVGYEKDDKGNNLPNSGEIIWNRKNLTGGSNYVLVPGYMTGSTELREKILPYLWGPMNVQYQIDVINTLRASRSMNIKPQILMERTPELFKAAQQLGFARAVPDGYESLGSDTIIELDGKPHFWMLPEDKDLKALQDDKQAELESYIATELSLTNTEVIKDAAVRNIQLALGIRSQQQGPMLSFESIGEREILKMWAYSITCEGGYGSDDWGLTSQKYDPYSILQPGEYVKVNKSTFNFDHTVEVITASMSEQERQFMVQAAMERKVARIGTWPEVIDAAGYQNRQIHMDELVEEEGYEGAATYYGTYFQPMFRKRMGERIGILVPDPLAQMAPPDAGSNQLPTSASQGFPVPQTMPVDGSSSTGSVA